MVSKDVLSGLLRAVRIVNAADLIDYFRGGSLADVLISCPLLVLSVGA